MTGAMKAARWTAVTAVLVPVACVGGKQIGGFLADREIAVAEQGLS